jgi:hypothetical protein
MSSSSTPCRSSRKLAAFVSRLQGRLVTASGPSDVATLCPVSAQIEHVLREREVHGRQSRNATMLDYFYLVERLRRWGNNR